MGKFTIVLDYGQPSITFTHKSFDSYEEAFAWAKEYARAVEPQILLAMEAPEQEEE